MLCKYKDSLGKPNEGIHSYRLFNIAIMDLLFTIIGSFILSYILNKSFFLIFIIIFLLGIFLHKIFCVDTTINRLLFG